MAEEDLETDFVSLAPVDTTRNELSNIYESHNKPSEHFCADIVNGRKELDDILTSRDAEGDTLLHDSIICGWTESALNWIELMLPEQLNIENNIRQTPLHIAAHTGNNAVLKSLIENGANISVQDNKGRTAVHIICEKGDSHSMKLLSVALKSANEENACAVTFQKITECLQKKNNNGQTCFHIACEKGNKDALTALLDIGMDINIQESKAGKTALHIAAEQGNVAVVRFLVKQRDIDLEKKTYDGATPLIGAYHRKYSNVVGALRNAGAVMNKRELSKFGPFRE